MKINTRIPYYSHAELNSMSIEDRISYNNSYKRLRKHMRALIAYQDSSDNIEKKPKTSIKDIAKTYGLGDSFSVVNRKIMEAFVGNEKYRNVVMPLYYQRNESARARYDSTVERRTTYSPLDYFDLYTLYHFYKFKSTIIKLEKERLENGVKRPQNEYGFDRLLAEAADKYINCGESKKNMFFNRNRIRFLFDEPLKSFTSIKELNELYKDDYKATVCEYLGKDIEDLESIPVTYEIKANVLNYMMSYIGKKIGENEANEQKDYYTNTSVDVLNSGKFDETATRYLAGLYDFNGQMEKNTGIKVIKKPERSEEEAFLAQYMEKNKGLEKSGLSDIAYDYEMFKNNDKEIID